MVATAATTADKNHRQYHSTTKSNTSKAHTVTPLGVESLWAVPCEHCTITIVQCGRVDINCDGQPLVSPGCAKVSSHLLNPMGQDMLVERVAEGSFSILENRSLSSKEWNAMQHCTEVEGPAQCVPVTFLLITLAL